SGRQDPGRRTPFAALLAIGDPVYVVRKLGASTLQRDSRSFNAGNYASRKARERPRLDAAREACHSRSAGRDLLFGAWNHTCACDSRPVMIGCQATPFPLERTTAGSPTPPTARVVPVAPCQPAAGGALPPPRPLRGGVHARGREPLRRGARAALRRPPARGRRLHHVGGLPLEPC